MRTEKRTMPALSEANRAAIEAQAYAAGTLRNTQVIEAMGMLGSIHKKWLGMQRRYLGEIRQSFGAQVLAEVPELERDVTGLPMIERLAKTMYRE